MTTYFDSLQVVELGLMSYKLLEPETKFAIGRDTDEMWIDVDLDVDKLLTYLRERRGKETKPGLGNDSFNQVLTRKLKIMCVIPFDKGCGRVCGVVHCQSCSLWR